jgi:DNA-directed RNA polymerase subunit RPC12/RpoP
MTACSSCKNELNNDYLNSAMDELSQHKDSPFYSIIKPCPHCQHDLLFKKIALSYYLVTDKKEIVIGGA